MNLDGVRTFHGHWCPGLGLGIRVPEVALATTGPHVRDEAIVAIVERDNCAVDAIQYLAGCTFGEGNLIHLDQGKNAFTRIRRSDGKAVRRARIHDSVPYSCWGEQGMATRARLFRGEILCISCFQPRDRQV